MKTNIFKLTNLSKAAAITIVFLIASIFSFSAVCSVSAAEIETETPTANFEIVPLYGDLEFENGLNSSESIDDGAGFRIVQLVDGADAGADDKKSDEVVTEKGSDASFEKVVKFFVKWIRRVGALVGFVGAIMFGLAIKNNDAEAKQSGLLTMVAGFAVAAICVGVDMFDIFS